MKRIAILNGPNLNLLGTREPEIYGSTTLDEIETDCRTAGRDAGIDVEFRQSNSEGQMVDWIQQAITSTDAIVINAAGYTHTSVAIRDALAAYPGLKVELHISNPHLREEFRRTSYIAPVVDAVVAGLGADGYRLVVALLPELLNRPR